MTQPRDVPIPIPGVPDLPLPDIGGVPGDLAGSIVDTLGRAITHGVAGIANSLFDAMTHALLSTTTVTLDGWFGGPWKAMLTVSATLAVPILLCGVLTEVVAGRPGVALRRGLALPLLIGPLLLAARAVLGLMLATVNGACALIVNVGIGGNDGYSAALQHMHSLFGLSALTGGGVTGTVVSAPFTGPALLLVLLATAALSFVIWIELALRAALIYLLAAFIPLALAGLFWSATARWTRRLLETLLAVILSQLVITVVMVLAAASLAAPADGLSAGIDQVAVGLALLFLGSVGLPMTMRLLPGVTEASIAAGTGALVASRARRTAAGLGQGRLAGMGGRLGVRPDLLQTAGARAAMPMAAGAAAGGAAGTGSWLPSRMPPPVPRPRPGAPGGRP